MLQLVTDAPMIGCMSSRRWRTLVSAGSALAFAFVGVAASQTATAITGGQPDGMGHPEVAVVLSSRGLPQCSGVYVQATPTRTVVLTDAHCLYSAGHLTGLRQVSFDPNWTAASPTTTGTFFIDPSYDPNTAAHDIAVIDLAQPDVTPGTLAPIGSAPIGAIVDIVGYGSPYVGQRRVGTETSTSAVADWLYLAARNANSCQGDSGGPDFLRGTDQVVALADLGTCASDQDIRIDTAEAQAFIAAAASWDTETPALTGSLSPAAAAPGTQISVTGATNPVFAGEPVRVQQLMGSTWSTIGSTKLARDGSYNLSLTATVPGTFAHRAVLSGTRTHPGAMSPDSPLRVQPVMATMALQNGDLERPTTAPWAGAGAVSRSASSRTGTAAVQVGRFRASSTDAVLTQTFLSPATGVLTADYQSHCADSVAYDWTAVVLIDDTAATSTTVLPRTCAQDVDWRATTPMPMIAGHTYTLIITTHDDGWPGDPTYALFDDITMVPSP